MTENEITTKFLQYAKARLNETFCFEAKLSKGNSLPFEALKAHQETALWTANHGVMTYKIPDVGLAPKPYDGFMLARVSAYVVVFWKCHRGDQRFTMIPIENWCKERESSERKSLLYDRSCEIGRCLEL